MPFDPEKPAITSGIRLGSPAGTTRGFGIAEFQQIGGMIIEVLDGLAANGDEGNGKVEASVKKHAIELCERYPIYESELYRARPGPHEVLCLRANHNEGPVTEESASFSDHPLRSALIEEVHARPFTALEPPVQASHLALVSGEQDAPADLAHLVRLCERFGLSSPTEGSKHFASDFGTFRLKWERHAEFCTYTFFRHSPSERLFAIPAISAVPRDWLESLPGERLVAVHIVVNPRTRPPPSSWDLATSFKSDTVSGSRVFGGAALLWTDFAVHEDGFGRILVGDISLDHFEVGRLVQRVLEIETYRMMALVALPLVRAHVAKISLIEEETAKIARNMSEIAGLDDTRALLTRLSRLSADVEGITASLSYRFDATRAYFALVRRRIERLREERLERLQTIEEFMERRLAPAMQMCDTAARRLASLSRRLARASDLLRTQVDVALQEQNRDLLRSMDRRANLQSRLQRILEVISVVALTYYLAALLTTILRALETVGVPLKVELIVGTATPFLLLIIWLGVRWTRLAVVRRYEKNLD